MVIEPGAVATELTDHITNPEAKQGGRTSDEAGSCQSSVGTRP
jgi:hypothetical protein